MIITRIVNGTEMNFVLTEEELLNANEEVRVGNALFDYDVYMQTSGKDEPTLKKKGAIISEYVERIGEMVQQEWIAVMEEVYEEVTRANKREVMMV